MIQTADDRLNFLVSFASMDLFKLREGDWLNVKEDLFDYITRFNTLDDTANLAITVSQGDNPSDWSEKEIQSIQEHVIKLLQISVRAKGLMEIMKKDYPWKGDEGFYGKGPTLAHGYPFRPHTLTFDLISGLPDPASKDRRFLSVSGSPIELFYIITFFLILFQPIDRILVCVSCQKIFIKGRKAKHAKYCGDSCQRKEINARYWKKQEEKESKARKSKRKPAAIRRGK